MNAQNYVLGKPSQQREMVYYFYTQCSKEIKAMKIQTQIKQNKLRDSLQQHIVLEQSPWKQNCRAGPPRGNLRGTRKARQGREEARGDLRQNPSEGGFQPNPAELWSLNYIYMG